MIMNINDEDSLCILGRPGRVCEVGVVEDTQLSVWGGEQLFYPSDQDVM